MSISWIGKSILDVRCDNNVKIKHSSEHANIAMAFQNGFRNTDYAVSFDEKLGELSAVSDNGDNGFFFTPKCFPVKPHFIYAVKKDKDPQYSVSIPFTIKEISMEACETYENRTHNIALKAAIEQNTHGISYNFAGGIMPYFSKENWGIKHSGTLSVEFKNYSIILSSQKQLFSANFGASFKYIDMFFKLKSGVITEGSNKPEMLSGNIGSILSYGPYDLGLKHNFVKGNSVIRFQGEQNGVKIATGYKVNDGESIVRAGIKLDAFDARWTLMLSSEKMICAKVSADITNKISAKLAGSLSSHENGIAPAFGLSLNFEH